MPSPIRWILGIRLGRLTTPSTQGRTYRRVKAHRDVEARGVEVGFGSKPAMPSTTEHSRSTFNCGRTVTLPNRPEVAETQNRNLEAVKRRRPETAVTPRRRALSEARQSATGR